MIKDFFYFILTASLLFSCSKKEQKLCENHYGKPVSLSKRELKIPIDASTLSSYQVLSTYYEKDKTDYIFAYNSKMHAIDIFNLKDKVISHIPLQSEGQNGVLEQAAGIYVHNPDSIWLYSQGNLYLLNKEGKVKSKHVLPFPTKGFIKIETNFSISTSNIFYHQERQSIFYLTATPTTESANYEAYEYSLRTNQFKSYTLKGGLAEEKSGRNFGWKQFPNVTFTPQYIVYNFPITSNIYCIDIETGKEYIHGGQSKYTPNIVSELKMPYDFKKADKHLLENVHFFALQYDPYGKVYYRLHLGKTDFNQNKDFNALYYQKKMYITVFNSRFEIINETELESGKYNYFNCWGVLDKGLFITEKATPEEKEENTFRMELFRIQ
ncbi:MAG: DUF4221 domain-containing protein [Bacteroides sp.]|jgi:hypothetical protein|nr:DUF4221 domain-containing protein [Bacteroides sp.]MCI1682430.1 DUF4221 domain-containing protein [Bacteroides sp.]